MTATIGIVSYGMGNIMSVQNAFAALGAKVFVAEKPAQLGEATHIALPGVGAFGTGIQNLRDTGFADALEKEILGKGKPFIGICLGMQLLATTGLEQGHHAGLNWVPGVVVRLPQGHLRVPLVGWCDVKVVHPAGLFDGCSSEPVFYFVHSYHFIPDSEEVVTSTCEYGIDFVSSIQKNNIFGTQFHPEKSHKAGLTLLKNFVNFQASQLC